MGGGVEGAYFDFYQNKHKVPYRTGTQLSLGGSISEKGMYKNGPCKPIFHWIASILTAL
jgi:hypothetical protein